MLSRVSYWRIANWILVPPFALCLLTVFSRLSRRPNYPWLHWMLEWSNQTSAVLLEHFAAGFGIPAFFVYWACMAASRPTKDPNVNPDLSNFITIMISLFAGVAIYAFGEALHEYEQLTLVKASNFGQFVADRCLNFKTITEYGRCTRNYFPTLLHQYIADATGMLAFMVLFLFAIYRFSKNEQKSFSSNH